MGAMTVMPAKMAMLLLLMLLIMLLMMMLMMGIVLACVLERKPECMHGHGKRWWW